MARIALALVFLIGLGGCATSATLKNGDSSSRTYHAPLNKVILATRYSLDTLNVNVVSSGVVGAYYTISFTKAVSLTSWGEVGKVDVSASREGGILVSVRSEKRSKYQLTGTDQAAFAKLIFEGVDLGLADLKDE